LDAEGMEAVLDTLEAAQAPERGGHALDEQLFEGAGGGKGLHKALVEAFPLGGILGRQKQVSGGAGSRVAINLQADVVTGQAATSAGADLAQSVRSPGAAGAVTPFDPQFASRQILNQTWRNGYAVTPAGRTVSAHAAEQIAYGGPGRPPTTLS